jgi:hypothetical protein
MMASEGDPIFYIGGDLLLWKVRGGTIPALANAVPLGVVTVEFADITVDPNSLQPIPGGVTTFVGYIESVGTTSAQFANSGTDTGSQSGLRINAGFWLDPDQSYGFEASAFILERGSDRFNAGQALNNGQGILNTGFENRRLIFTPGTIGEPATLTEISSEPVFLVRDTQQSLVGRASTALCGAEINGRSVFLRVGGVDIGGIGGARIIGFTDELNISNFVQVLRPPTLPPSQGDQTSALTQNLTFSTYDRIRMYNTFVGAQLGFSMDAKFGAFFIDARIKGAFGNMHQSAHIDSQTVVTNIDTTGTQPNPPSRTTPGGLLFGPNDPGKYSRNKFAFVPEANVKFGYQFTNWFRAHLGYDGLYMSHAARAGASSVINNVNTTVTLGTSTNSVGGAAPGFRFRDQDVWVQGLNLGCEFIY